MELPYLKTANSLFMWISCIPAVALVFFQAYIFMKRAWKTGPQMGVTKEQMKEAAKSSLVASIGPSIVIVTGMVSLLASVGGPLAWMRLAFIGSVMYELPGSGPCRHCGRMPAGHQQHDHGSLCKLCMDYDGLLLGLDFGFCTLHR